MNYNYKNFFEKYSLTWSKVYDILNEIMSITKNT